VRNGGYWCSESVCVRSKDRSLTYQCFIKSVWLILQAVRVSSIHYKLHIRHLRRTLSQLLAPSARPDPSMLYALRILPSPSLLTSPSISARGWELERHRSRDQVTRALKDGQVGQRSLGEVISGHGNRWGDEGVKGERVRWALCPGIRDKKRFFENLSRGESGCGVIAIQPVVL